MILFTTRRSLAALLLIAICSGTATAVEIQLKSDVTVSNTIVTLADVAVFVGNEPSPRLGAIELFPAPPRGRHQRVSRITIQQRLDLHGVDAGSFLLTGADTVVVRRSEARVENPRASLPAIFSRPTKPLTAPGELPFTKASRIPSNGRRLFHRSTSSINRYENVMARQADSRVARAVHDFLVREVGDSRWEVDVDLASHVARHIPAHTREIRVSGGKAPWTGPQQFTIAFQYDGQMVQVPVAAKVKLPPYVVVPTRRIGRGEVLRAADLVLTRRPLDERMEGNTFSQIDEVIGKEAIRTIIADQPVLQQSVRNPTLVKRQQNVVVFARTPGIVIRTYGVALEDGQLNNLIRVQPIDSERRKEFFVARVVAAGRVELLANSAEYDSQRPIPQPSLQGTAKTPQPLSSGRLTSSRTGQ